MGFSIKINYMYDVVVITCISRRGNLHTRRRNTKASVVVTVVIFVVVTCNAARLRKNIASAADFFVRS